MEDGIAEQISQIKLISPESTYRTMPDRTKFLGVYERTITINNHDVIYKR